MTFSYYKNYLYTHRYKLSSEKEKKKKSKESHYMVSHPETGSDSPIGSDRESGRDKYPILRQVCCLKGFGFNFPFFAF